MSVLPRRHRSPAAPLVGLCGALGGAWLLGTSLACWAPVPQSPTDDGDPAEAPVARDWPQAPFTAWTARGPASIVGPGGDTLALVEPAGVRVTVLQTLPVRVRVRCVGCPPPHRDIEGWLQAEAIWWPGSPEPRPADDPLTAGLDARARWAAGQDLPAGADADALCALVDQGFRDQPAAWRSEGASLVHLPGEGLQLEGSPLPAPGACRLEPPPPDPATD